MILAINKLREYKSKKGLHQQRMADSFFITNVYLSMILGGKYKPSKRLKAVIEHVTKKYVKIKDWDVEAED